MLVTLKMSVPPGGPHNPGLPSANPSEQLGRAQNLSLLPPNSAGLSHPLTTSTGVGNDQQNKNLIGTPTQRVADLRSTQPDNMGTPKQLSSAARDRKRRKPNSPLAEDDANVEETLNSQKKFTEYLEKMFKEIDNLNSTLGDKTKRETRAFSEKIAMYKNLIIESNMLSNLDQTIQNYHNRILDDQAFDDDVSMTSDTSKELVCSKCKKKLEDEQQTKNEARKFVEELHLEDPPCLNESHKAMILKKWPEDAFQKTEIYIANPLQSPPEGDQLLVLKTPDDTAYIYRKMKETNADLKTIIEEEVQPGKIQFLENITRVRNKEDSCRRVYVTCGESTNDLYLSLKELEMETRTSKNSTLSIIVADEKTRTTVRKLLEAVFLQSNLMLKLYAPRRENINGHRENRYDSIVVNSNNKSYCDMLKTIRENLNPEEMGIGVHTIKKLKDNSLLIMTDKGKKDILTKELSENNNFQDITIIEKKCDLILAGMDAVTTNEEVMSALKQKINGQEGAITIKSMYENRNSEQIATISLSEDNARKLLESGPIKIGWTMCRVKEKIRIFRCTNCLKMGHTQKTCKAKKSDTKKCLKCLQPGHESKDCENISHCISCDKEGHRSDSMSCPKYRKLVYQKGSNL